MLAHGIIVRSLPLVLLVLDGCMALDADDEALATGSSERAIVAMNGLPPEDLGFASQFMDWLRLNALTTNSSAVGRMIRHPLNSGVYDARQGGSVHPGPYLIDQLCDPYARQVMKRVVECALAGSSPDVPAQSVTWRHTGLAPETWYGAIGLCPQWYTGLPSPECLERVSACVLARLNEEGQTVSISMRGRRGTNDILPIEAGESTLHDRADGAFFGTVFDPAQLDAIRVEVTSCTATGAALWYTDGNHRYSYRLLWNGEPPAQAQRDYAHEQFLLQSGFDRAVYRKAFACWDLDASVPVAIDSGRVCTGLVADVDCAVTSVGPCPDACTPAMDANGVRYYTECTDPDNHGWQWPLDVFYDYDPEPEPGAVAARVTGAVTRPDSR